MSDSPLLRVDDLSRRFGRRWAVARVSFELDRGESLMLTGANGSGKSTLLKCLATALKHQTGTAELDGQPLWEKRGTLRRRIAFLSHASRTYEDLSAQENLRVWSGLAGTSVDVGTSLERVGLDPSRRDPVRTFSAGMKRRLALALALIKKPDLFLLDEPFSALDPEGRALVVRLAEEVREQGAALIVATHLPGQAARLCPRAVHLDAGQIVWRGPAAEHPGVDA